MTWLQGSVGVGLKTHGLHTTPGPYQTGKAAAGATFSSKLGSALSQSVEWPLSLEPAQLEDVSTAVENFKKGLMGVQWYSVLDSQPQFRNKIPSHNPNANFVTQVLQNSMNERSNSDM